MEVGWDGRPYRVAKREAGMTNFEERQRDGRPCRGMPDNRVNKYRGVKYKCTLAFEFAEG